MIKRNFNYSVPNEHLESITFCELNNEDEGKVTDVLANPGHKMAASTVTDLMRSPHPRRVLGVTSRRG